MPNLPLPKGLPKMARNYVYLGKRGEFKKVEGEILFRGRMCSTPRSKKDKRTWSIADNLQGTSEAKHYSAPKDSPIAILNRVQKS